MKSRHRPMPAVQIPPFKLVSTFSSQLSLCQASPGPCFEFGASASGRYGFPEFGRAGRLDPAHGCSPLLKPAELSPSAFSPHRIIVGCLLRNSCHAFLLVADGDTGNYLILDLRATVGFDLVSGLVAGWL